MGRGIWTTFGAISVAVLVCAAGCQKDKPAQSDSEADSPGASRPIARAESGHHRGSIALDTWPADTSAIVAIDTAQFRRSPVGALVDNLLRTTALSPGACGTSLLEQADQVLILSLNSNQSSPIYVLGGVARTAGADCANQPSVWLDDHTVAFGPGWEQPALAAATSGKGHRTNPRVLASISDVDTHAALWFAAARPADADDWNEEFTEMRGAIALDGGLHASFSLKYADETRAADAATEFERSLDNLPPFSQYLEDARAHADGPWLQVRVIMSRDQLKRFAADPIFSGLFPQQEPDVQMID